MIQHKGNWCLEVANPTNKQDEAKHMTEENVSGKGEKNANL